MGIVIGIIVVLALAAFFAILTCKSKSCDLYKWVGIFLFIAVALTWVLPYGQFSGGTFVDAGMQRLGLSDLSVLAYYGSYFCLTTVVFLLILGGFYGVVSKTNGYQRLVKKFASTIEGKELISTIIISVLVIVATSFMNNAFAVVIFLPFLASVLANAKLDKMTTFATTYGSLLVGILAATYGTESLSFLNYYLSAEITVGLTYRLIIAAFALVLYVVFNAIMLKRKLGKKVSSAEKDDLFAIEEDKKNNKASVWPVITLFSVLFVIVVLGFFGWENYGITCFKDFHTWLSELTVGKEFKLFSYILGTNALAFGSFELTTIASVLLILTVIYAFMSKISLKDFMDNFGYGVVRFLKPVSLYVLSFVIFVVCYLTPFVGTIINGISSLSETFSPYLTALSGLIASIFHQDLGYTAYLVSSQLSTNYSDYLDIAHTLYVGTYGLAQLFIPSSGLLLLGLSCMKIDYKSWFKYIWIFVVAMVVVLLVLATIVTY